MTSEEITQLVVAELGLQDITAFDETGLVNLWVHQGTIDVLARTRCTVRCVHLRVTPGQGQYTLDHSILALVDVEDGWRQRQRRDEHVTAVPAFTLVRSDVLVVKPTPSEDGELDVWAVLKPAKMTAPTDSPGDEGKGAVPEEFQDAIVLYALWKGSSYSDDQSGGQGERYRAQYEGQDGRSGRLAQIRVAVNKRGTARAPRARVLLPVGHRAKASWAG